MNTGLWVFYALMLIGLLVSANKHGKPRCPDNFWITLLATAICLLLVWWALHWRIY